MSITREEVISVLGPVDDALITDIVTTGATLEELMRAWGWINNDEALVKEGISPPSGRTAELVELLSQDDEEDEL
ncbi:hypothetical protein DUT91_00050 [Phyllobacterium salinisoli]|uniref:Uncharacterized protein n=1 Tax=Phyllobacterium salinisoli TaxID=1899321 RepID=A0A368KBH2_9HYPH|nr:hypothetical protein [Phyllobacterium salinisoli]RCS25853.1 hypothetical protein DUT91_00050 [Phyllobacterium salinisoli]